MNCCIYGGHFWRFFWGDKALLCLRFVPLLFLGCINYGIYSVPWLVRYTIQILHLVPMMIYCLVYCELLFLSLVGLTLCSCSQTIIICECRLIGGEKLLIVWADLDWLLPDVVCCKIIGGGNIYLQCIALPWSGFWTSGFPSLHCLPYDYLGYQLLVDVHDCHCHF